MSEAQFSTFDVPQIGEVRTKRGAESIKPDYLMMQKKFQKNSSSRFFVIWPQRGMVASIYTRTWFFLALCTYPLLDVKRLRRDNVLDTLPLIGPPQAENFTILHSPNTISFQNSSNLSDFPPKSTDHQARKLPPLGFRAPDQGGKLPPLPPCRGDNINTEPEARFIQLPLPKQ